jgi:hypothetical protein
MDLNMMAFLRISNEEQNFYQPLKFFGDAIFFGHRIFHRSIPAILLRVGNSCDF